VSGSGKAGVAVADGARVAVAVGGTGVLKAVGDGAGVSRVAFVGDAMTGLGALKPEAAWLTNWQAIKKGASRAIQRRMVLKLYLFLVSFFEA
jgi:hypothetical protein